MTSVMAEAPAPGSPETSVLAVGARGDWAPSPATRQGVQGGRVVFVDFGRGKVYAVTADGEEVYTFDSIGDLVGKLNPDTVVVDSLPGKFQKTAAELGREGVVFLRLKRLKILSDERKSNGVRKTDENDVKLLREIFRRDINAFQPLFTSPEELEVRALTELWVELSGMKKAAKQARTATNDHIAVEAGRTLRQLVERLSARIHERALVLPLYRRAVEELGLKGPSLAYIISHDGWALATMPRDALAVRYDMARQWIGRRVRSRLLILLANTAILHKHPRYRSIYEHYRQKGKKHWTAVLRVAKRILRDLRQQAQKAGPPV